jgi:membrane protease YdiL (CAAX protease family)
MGRFSENAYVYWCVGVIPAAAVVVITCLQNHDIRDLGFYPDHLACDGIVMSCMLIVELLIGVCLLHMSWRHAVTNWLYYIFWVALQEELVYRGFIQSHLFSPHLNRKVSYLIGAAMFSASHIPYQMQIRSWDSLFTIQLCIVFSVHLVYCRIIEKRGNLCFPLAIHVATDFLQTI